MGWFNHQQAYLYIYIYTQADVIPPSDVQNHIYVHLSEVRVACLGGVCSWRSQDGPRQVVSTPPWWHTISDNCILLLQVDVFDVVDAVYTTVFVYIDFETETEVIQSMTSFIYTNKYHLYILFVVMFIYDSIYKYVWIHDTIVNTQKGNCFEISFGYITESLSPHVDPSRQASQKNREDPFTLRHSAIEWWLWFPKHLLKEGFLGVPNTYSPAIWRVWDV